jgi:hypothetical protein
MRKRIAFALYSLLFSAGGIAACAPIETSDNYAQVCDDAKEPDCSPNRKVVVE